jgi:transposase
MRTPGTANELQYRRRRATQRVAAGYSTQVAADFFGVDPWTLQRWLAESGFEQSPAIVP